MEGASSTLEGAKADFFVLTTGVESLRLAGVLKDLFFDLVTSGSAIPREPLERAQ
jgi:hypothetical protein